MQQHLRAAEEQLREVGALGHSINDLNNLLKLPHLRAQFGEASLCGSPLSANRAVTSEVQFQSKLNKAWWPCRRDLSKGGTEALQVGVKKLSVIE